MKFGLAAGERTFARPHDFRSAGDPGEQLGLQGMLRPPRTGIAEREAERGNASRQPFPAEQDEGHVRSRRLAGEPRPSGREACGGDRGEAIGEIEQHEAEPLSAEQDLARAQRFSLVRRANPQQAA